MTATQHQPTGRRATRDLKHARARARLPLTFLGTYDDRTPGSPEEGWQPHMWSHHAFLSGAVYAAGIAVHQAVEAGILESAAWTSAGTAATGVFAGIAGVLATAGEKFTDWARAYFACTPVAAGAYLAAVAHTSPFSTGALVAAAAGTAIGMAGYYKMRTEQDDHELRYVSTFRPPNPGPQRKPAAPQAAPPVHEEIDPEARQWNQAFEKVGLKGCRYRYRKDTPAGFAVLVRLPDNGSIGPEQVGAKLPHLERALGMLRDCLEFDTAVNAEGREKSDCCWIVVDVEDILSKLLPMPDDEQAHTPTRLQDGFRIGTFIDGTPMFLRLREISALIVGVRGRGKTNLFHVMVHQLSRCIDVLLWAIDLKGGRAVKPWLRAWLEGRASRPIFDWVATTRAEATLMIHAAKALIDFRGTAGRGGSKLEPSPEHPGVIVMADESAALVGQHSGPRLANRAKDWWRNPSAGQISSVLTLCIQLGRSEAVDFVLFTQRGTVSMTGGGDLKSQCELRIGLGVTNPADASSVFQNNNINAKKLRKLKDKRTRGACLIENGEDPNHLAGKVYFYGDDTEMMARIDRAATAHAMYPADLDLPEQQAIHDALLTLTDGVCGYGVGPEDATTQRWSMERSAHLYTDGLPDAWVDDDPGDDDHLGGTAPTSGPGTTTTTRPAPAAGPTAPTYNSGPHIPTSPGHPPADPYYTRRTNPPPNDPAQPTNPDKPPADKYYTRRADRQPAEPASPSDPDPETRQYQDEFDRLCQWLETAPDATEPVYDTSDPEQQTRYQTMLEVIRAAGTAGIRAGEIMRHMVARGHAWSQRSQLHPALKRARKAGLIDQPWDRGPYYWHEHAPKSGN